MRGGDDGEGDGDGDNDDNYSDVECDGDNGEGDYCGQVSVCMGMKVMKMRVGLVLVRKTGEDDALAWLGH